MVGPEKQTFIPKAEIPTDKVPRARLIKDEILLARRIRDAQEEYGMGNFEKGFFEVLINLRNMGIEIPEARRMISPYTDLNLPKAMPDADKETVITGAAQQGQKAIAAIRKCNDNLANTVNVPVEDSPNFVKVSAHTCWGILKTILRDLENQGLTLDQAHAKVGMLSPKNHQSTITPAAH